MSAATPSESRLPSNATDERRLLSVSFVGYLLMSFLTAVNDSMYRWLIIPLAKQQLADEIARIEKEIEERKKLEDEIREMFSPAPLPILDKDNNHNSNGEHAFWKNTIASLKDRYDAEAKFTLPSMEPTAPNG